MKCGILLLLFCLCLACEKDSLANPKDCTEDLIEALDFTPYEDQAFDCNVYLSKIVWREESYFYFGGHCFDFVFVPFDCEQRPLKEIFNDDLYEQFLKESMDAGIVAFLE